MTLNGPSGCVVVTGMPGAGKTTITGLAADRLPRAAQLGGDEVNGMIRSGFVWFMGKPTEEAVSQDALMSPRPVRLVVLAPGIEVCRNRNAQRAPEEQFAFDGYERLGADMERELGDDGWWIDTSALTPEQTADELVAYMEQRAATLVPGWSRSLRRLHR